MPRQGGHRKHEPRERKREKRGKKGERKGKHKESFVFFFSWGGKKGKEEGKRTRKVGMGMDLS